MVKLYSIVECFNEYQKNKYKINSYLNGKYMEKYQDDDPDDKEAQTILGLSITIFIVILIINLIFLIVFFVIYIKNFKYLPVWAQITAPILALFFGPIGFVIGIIIIMTSRSNTKR